MGVTVEVVVTVFDVANIGLSLFELKRSACLLTYHIRQQQYVNQYIAPANWIKQRASKNIKNYLNALFIEILNIDLLDRKICYWYTLLSIARADKVLIIILCQSKSRTSKVRSSIPSHLSTTNSKLEDGLALKKTYFRLLFKNMVKIGKKYKNIYPIDP